MQRYICGQIAARVKERAHVGNSDLSLDTLPAPVSPDPEHQISQIQQQKVLTAALQSLRPRDKEVLDRFYLQEQSKEQICAEMDLTETQFRLLKSRAKQKLLVVVQSSGSKRSSTGANGRKNGALAAA